MVWVCLQRFFPLPCSVVGYNCKAKLQLCWRDLGTLGRFGSRDRKHPSRNGTWEDLALIW